MDLRHLVVDGSNIATEGRDLPSLVQLDEAVQAFIAEFGPQLVTVVVDASFPNRIDRSERQVYEDAVVAGEIITPPAGAIGRGDAFILQIADRAQATILSNDSFQEFHGQYDWLFDPGRLVGGKPVPHVGWVFVDRTPVRGPTSRRAVSLAKQAAAAAAKPKAARAPKAEKTAKAAKAETTAKARKAGKTEKVAKAAKSATAEKTARAPGAGKAEKVAKASKSGRAGKVAKAAEVAGQPPAASPAAASAKRDDAGAGDAPPGYNEALPFIEFVGAHPVGSRVDGIVEQFSSHGAYVRVDGVLGYAPLKHLADPAPRSARQVLRIGEARPFVVAAVDPTRRGVDLALPGVPLDPQPPSSSAASSATTAPAPPAAEPSPEPKPSRRGRSSRKPAPAADSAPAATEAPAAKAAKVAKATKVTKAAKSTKKAAKAAAKKAPAGERKPEGEAPAARRAKAATKKADEPSAAKRIERTLARLRKSGRR